MNFFVAIMAKHDDVRFVVSQFWESSPREYVVSLHDTIVEMLTANSTTTALLVVCFLLALPNLLALLAVLLYAVPVSRAFLHSAVGERQIYAPSK